MPEKSALVLVVDDDGDTRRMLEDILGEEGYGVLTAHDGHEALAALRAATQPLVVVLDEVMPEMAGSAVLQQAHQDAALVQQPHVFILMTASADRLPATVRQLAQEAGVPVLAKPFDIEALLAMVGEADQRVARASEE